MDSAIPLESDKFAPVDTFRERVYLFWTTLGRGFAE